MEIEIGLNPKNIMKSDHNVRKNTYEQVIKAKELYDSGKNLYEVARFLNVSTGLAYKRLKEVGANFRNNRFQKGHNVWLLLSPKEKLKRKQKLSEIMSRYNPMKNPHVQLRRSRDEKKRRGNIGLLTHREKRRLIQKIGQCQKCGIKFPLTVHHRNGNRYDSDEKNLIVVCFNCHYILDQEVRKQLKVEKSKIK